MSIVEQILKKNQYKLPKPNDQLTINKLRDYMSGFKSINLVDKKNVKILIIDDEGFDEAPLKKLGYLDIDKIYEHSKIGDYTNYDVIFCDINNVAIEFNNQGAELANQIKEEYPDKCVVIFTGNPQNISIANEYKFKVDDMIEKNADASQFAKIINEHIEKKYNPVLCWKFVEKEMHKKGITNKEIAIIEHFYVKSIIDRYNYFNKDMIEYNKNNLFTKDVLSFVTTVGEMVVVILEIIGMM